MKNTQCRMKEVTERSLRGEQPVVKRLSAGIADSSGEPTNLRIGLENRLDRAQVN